MKSSQCVLWGCYANNGIISGLRPRSASYCLAVDTTALPTTSSLAGLLIAVDAVGRLHSCQEGVRSLGQGQLLPF